MNIMVRQIEIIRIYTLIVLVITGCTINQKDPEIDTRPACVTLEDYSYVIEQVMNVQPNWELLAKPGESYQYRWTVEDEGGYHTLSTTLRGDACVCATASSSQFDMGSGKEEIVGLLQGAAVIPISDLNYISSWLEPKILFSCGIAYVLQQPYEAVTTMEDETTWTLTCSRNSGCDGYDSLYTLTIIAPSCVDMLE